MAMHFLPQGSEAYYPFQKNLSVSLGLINKNIPHVLAISLTLGGFIQKQTIQIGPFILL